MRSEDIATSIVKLNNAMTSEEERSKTFDVYQNMLGGVALGQFINGNNYPNINCGNFRGIGKTTYLKNLIRHNYKPHDSLLKDNKITRLLKDLNVINEGVIVLVGSSLPLDFSDLYLKGYVDDVVYIPPSHKDEDIERFVKLLKGVNHKFHIYSDEVPAAKEICDFLIKHNFDVEYILGFYSIK